MFGGLASQCTFSMHWHDATPLHRGVGRKGGGGGGAGEEGEGGREWGVGGGMGGGGGGWKAGGVYFLWEDRWRRVLNSPTVPAKTALLSRLFHSRILLGKKLFLKTGVEACWMWKHCWWFLANCCTTFFWFSDLVGLINLLFRIGARRFSAFIPARCP